MDATEQLHFHFSLSCIGEGNGNPRQCSCLENPSNGGAWWAAVYGVAQSPTRLKRLSSSRAAPSPTVSASLFSMTVSLLLPCKQIHQDQLSRFHIYVLIDDLCFYLSVKFPFLLNLASVAFITCKQNSKHKNPGLLGHPYLSTTGQPG